MNKYIYLWKTNILSSLSLSLSLSLVLSTIEFIVCRNMQQSRLDKFFTIKTSAPASKSTENNDGSTAAAKRSSTNENENNKKFKRTQSDISTINPEDDPQSTDKIETSFSLNQFYLDKFLAILSSLLKHHQCLFNDQELLLFNKFQTLAG